MQNDILTFTWRTDKDTRDWLQKIAKQNGRSMNSQLSELVSAAKKSADKKTV